MKPKSNHHSILFGCGSLLAASCLHAATLTWDPSGGGTSDGAGAWLDTGKWWDGVSANVDWTSDDDAVFGNGGAGGAVGLASPTTANSITLNAFTGTYDLGTNGQTLTVTNGITANVGVGTTDFEGTVDNSGTDLTVNVLEATPADRNTANIFFRQGISGAGSFVKEGPGSVWLSGGTLSYTGDTIVNGGLLRVGTSGYIGGTPGNLTLNGGVAEAYWGETFTRSLGAGSGQVQITGGTSGFSQHGGNTLTVKLNNSTSTPVVWGSTHFNPSVLQFQTINSNSGANVLFDNVLDLNDAQRTIHVEQGDYTGVKAEMNQRIYDSGTTAGLTKTGPGELILDTPGSNDTALWNNYNGPTIVNGGTLQIGTGWSNTWNAESLPATSNLTINDAIVEAYYYLTRDLGTGAGEIQITGGRAGFSNLQGDATGNAFIKFTDNSTVVNWGDATFNPSTLVLNDFAASTVLRTQNPFNLGAANRTVEVNNTGSGSGRGSYATFEGVLSGAGGSLTKTGPGTLMLTGANTYDGGTTINGGALYFRSASAMPATGTVTVNDGATLVAHVGGSGWSTATSGAGSIGGLLSGLGASGNTVSYVGNVNVGLAASSDQVYAGNIADVGTSLGLYIGNKDGGPTSDPFSAGGSFELSGNNTLSGDIAVYGGGTLTLSGDNSGASGDALLVNGYLSAGTANLTAGNVNFGSPGNDPAIWLNSGAVAVDLGSANDVFFSGNGGFAATDSALTVTVNSGATIDWSAGTGFNGKKLMLGSPTSTASVELSNDIDLDGNRNIYRFDNGGSNADIAILSGDISGGGSNRNLTIEGNGTTVLSGANNFGNGILYVGSGGANAVVRATDGVGLPTAAKLYFNNGVLESSGSFTRDIGSGNGQVYWNNKGGFAANGGPLTVNLEGGIALNWGDTNAGFRNQDPLYFGSDTADNVVTFENGIILNNNRNIQVTDNPDTDADYAVITGVISQSGTRNLDKEGNGTLFFEGNNTYTGTTTINGGTLIINGDQTTATGLVDVKGSGRVLGGTGTHGGNVTLENNSGLTFDLSTAAGSHDKLDVLGSFTFESASVLTITSSGGASPGTYTLVTAGSAPTGSVPATVNLPVDWTADAPQIVGNDLVINITSTGAASSPYDTWADGFLPDDVSDPAGNFDSDTLSNLLEFAFGTNPTVSDAVSLNPDGSVNGLPIVQSSGSGGGITFDFLFMRRTDHATSGITYTAQFSNELGTWYDSTVPPTTVAPASTGYEVVSVPYPATLPNGKKARFARMEITEVP